MQCYLLLPAVLDCTTHLFTIHPAVDTAEQGLNVPWFAYVPLDLLWYKDMNAVLDP